MGQVRFFSDPHFGHENMAKNRGYPSAEMMNEHIITLWNMYVHKKDTVWILGDITMEKDGYEILDRLLGYKKIVLGNHDKPQHVSKLLKYVNSVCGVKSYREAWLTHIPIHPIEMRKRKFNIHGHVHSSDIPDPRYYNVSFDAIEYPRTYEEIYETIKQRV